MTELLDFHAHILPRADHGSSSVDTSLCQISMARQSGVSCIMATPHFYPAEEGVAKFLERRDRAYNRLLEALEGTAIRIVPGAEVLICDNIENLPMIEELCIKGTHTLLLELPFTDFDKGYRSSVSALIKRGINVVIAHADRYNRENIDSLIAVGAKIQLNSASLSSLFVKKHLYAWIDAGVVVGLGSDIHREDKKAYKNFQTALRKMGSKRAEKIMLAAWNILNN